MFLSDDTVRNAYTGLIRTNIPDPSIFWTFLILKASGYNNLDYYSLDLIKDRALPSTAKLSTLFSPLEIHPKTHEFINPFDMREWGGQKPTELLKKYVSSCLIVMYRF